MSQRQWVVIIGVWVMVFPFIGFPTSWVKAFALLTGLVLIAYAYRIRFRESASASNRALSEEKPVPSAAPEAENDNQPSPLA